MRFPPAAVPWVGLTRVTLGALALLTVKVCAVEVPPPGAGLNTVTCDVPAAAMSLAGIAAVSWVELTDVVIRFAPFQRTTEPFTKLLPFTVKVNAAPPAIAPPGFRLVVLGSGLPDP